MVQNKLHPSPLPSVLDWSRGVAPPAYKKGKTMIMGIREETPWVADRAP